MLTAMATLEVILDVFLPILIVLQREPLLPRKQVVRDTPVALSAYLTLVRVEPVVPHMYLVEYLVGIIVLNEHLLLSLRQV